MDIDGAESKASTRADDQTRKRAADSSESSSNTKPKKKQNSRPRHVLHQATLRKPSWTYFHLRLFSSTLSSRPSEQEELDILTAKRYLNAALQRFLGLHGTAIPLDILKLEGRSVWIRVPRDDAAVVHEAVVGWVGGGDDDAGEVGVKWVAERRDEWLVRLAMGKGDALFRPD